MAWRSPKEEGHPVFNPAAAAAISARNYLIVIVPEKLRCAQGGTGGDESAVRQPSAGARGCINGILHLAN
jgi:hypothetical protein